MSQLPPTAVRLSRWGTTITLAVCVLAFSGCRLLHPREVMIGKGYEPENIFSAAPVLPAELKRVLVLPLATDERVAALASGRETLDPVLTSELLKTRKFEVVRVTSEALRMKTGGVGWNGEEVLPENFFTVLQESFGCDAVLFCQLTTFRAYAPLAVGWRMKLVDVRSRQILWAGDEVFDAGQSAVKNGARRYQLEHLPTVESGAWMMENSPRHFGQYTLAKLLDTLPVR
ncbi:MAG: hypothetical protein H7Y43_10695 [Akkermansiaceae bacterium]|nr:hypothetical protein [Verrucomicrobiales bacterium]